MGIVCRLSPLKKINQTCLICLTDQWKSSHSPIDERGKFFLSEHPLDIYKPGDSIRDLFTPDRRRSRNLSNRSLDKNHLLARVFLANHAGWRSPTTLETFHAELPGMSHPTDSEVGTCSFRFALLRLATWQQRQQLQILPAFRAKFNRSPLTNGGKGTQSFLLGPKGSFSRASCQTSRLYIYPSNVPYFFPLNKFSSQKFLKVFNEDDFFWNKIYKSQRDFEPEWRWPRCLHQWPQGLELPMDFHVSRNRIHWGVLFFSLARYPNTLEIKAKFWTLIVEVDRRFGSGWLKKLRWFFRWSMLRFQRWKSI